jgi:hypothetical protein
MPDRGVFWRNFEEIARVLRPGGFVQVQFRGRHGLKQRVVRVAPASLVPAARFLYRSARMKRSRRSLQSDPDDPGREQTWELGVAVRPERVLKSLRKMGFADVKVERDTGYADGRRYWVTGRKGGAQA